MIRMSRKTNGQRQKHRPRFSTCLLTFGAILAVYSGAAAFCVTKPSFPASGSGFRVGRVENRQATRLARSTSQEFDGGLAPLGSNVLLQFDEVDETTAGGIILPTNQRSKNGRVVAVGPGRVRRDGDAAKHVAVGLAVGQHVMYSKYAVVSEVEAGDAVHGLVHEDDVIAISEDPKIQADSLRAPRGRLLVAIEEIQTETEDGFLLSKGAAKQNFQGARAGIVIAVGDDDPVSGPAGVAVGDRVFYTHGEAIELSSPPAADRVESLRQADCIARVAKAPVGPVSDVFPVPTSGRVLIQVEQAVTETAEGLLLSHGAAKDMSGSLQTGVVVGVGESDAAGFGANIKEGDIVYFEEGIKISLDSKTNDGYFVSALQADCLAKVSA